MTTQGNRHDMPNDEYRGLKPGDYGKDSDGFWICCTPNGYLGTLAKHDVIEHEDKSITVSPSILVIYPEDGKEVEKWHGFLERGVWREV